MATGAQCSATAASDSSDFVRLYACSPRGAASDDKPWKDTIPKRCTECDVATGNVTEPAIKWTIAHTQGGRHGIISSDEDPVIKPFFGFGQNDCSGSSTFPTGLYPEGLADLRTLFKTSPGAAMYVVHSSSSSQHVWTTMSPGAVTLHGVDLRDWLKEFLDPSSTWQDVLP